MQSTNDLYKILGLSSSASQDDIRKAHRKLVRTYHPDANPQDPQAEERFKAVQQAYEILSNENKRQEYDDKRFHTSSRGASRRPRPRGEGADQRTRGESTSTVDLSNLLGKLANLSSDRSSGREDGRQKQQGEDIARLAKQLGVNISSLSKLLGENIKVNAQVSFGNTRAGRSSASDEDVSGGKPSGASDKAQEKRVKGPSAQRRRKSD